MITTIIAFILAYLVMWPLALAAPFAVVFAGIGWSSVRGVVGLDGLWSLQEVAFVQGSFYGLIQFIALVAGVGVLAVFSRQQCLWYLVGLHALTNILALRYRTACNPVAAFIGGLIALGAGTLASIWLYT